MPTTTPPEQTGTKAPQQGQPNTDPSAQPSGSFSGGVFSDITATRGLVGGINQGLAALQQRIQAQLPLITPPTEQQLAQNPLLIFGPSFNTFAFEFNNDFQTTTKRLLKAVQANTRPNEVPATIQPWECRVGGSKFFVPPANINVAKSFRSGSIMSGALRQSNPPKFNTGHSETTIAMTLYFPNFENVWGYTGANDLEIDFDLGDYRVVDNFLSSLRGLIAQFKYAPFLPIKNQYLNEVHGITAVALEGLTISTMENFPFCIVAELHMLKFAYKTYLPMIPDFNEAIHWGRFRAYIGRAAIKLQQQGNQEFAVANSTKIPDSVANIPFIEGAITGHQPNDFPSSSNVSVLGVSTLGDGIFTDSLSNLTNIDKTTALELYYPDHDPARIPTPFDIGEILPGIKTGKANGSWWQDLLRSLHFGSDLFLSPEWQYQNMINFPQAGSILGELQFVKGWLADNNYVANNMDTSKLNAYIKQRLAQMPHLTPLQIVQEKHDITYSWFKIIYDQFLGDPQIQAAFALQQYLEGTIIIEEWQIPMVPLGLGNFNIIVHNVSVTMGNNFARLQLNMVDDPIQQHIGGADTIVDITMTAIGEEALTHIRLMFETINGLGRLEHTHAVLGFLGIKNVITALCGCRFLVPLTFDVDTLPNYPHSYTVHLTFLDFDVLQQKREELSSDQQQEFIDSFSKRNPFLRVQQTWGQFNAYPDFPLSVKDDAGRIIGHLDPDYYFRSFQTIDDDIVNWRQGKLKSLKPPGTQKQVQDYEVVHHFGTMSNDGTATSIGLDAGGFDLLEDGKPFAAGCSFNEPHTGNVNTQPFTPGCTPAPVYNQPYWDGSGDPSKQFDLMLQDTQYRDKSGRMVRAFPTYMLWLIDEGGQFAGIKLFDNLYGLQSVLDMSLVRSEDIMADTLILKLSNLYDRLSAPYRNLLDPGIIRGASIANQQINIIRDTLSGFTDFLVKIDTIQLAPGVRVHLRLGYSANPTELETVFNGVITQVEQGDVITLVCQSDAVELSSIINGKNTHGSSGKEFDGSFNLGGMWLSEPRDLIVRLLSMGASTFKEAWQWALHGMIFSENKFGIRHFGHVLYQPMTKSEKTGTASRVAKLAEVGTTTYGNLLGQPAPAMAGMLDMSIAHIATSLWVNFNARRDYEVYKRNVYPGNGLGVSQYTGGDLGDGGLAVAFTPVGSNAANAFGNVDPNTGSAQQTAADQASADINLIAESQKATVAQQKSQPKASSITKLADPWALINDHPIRVALGLDRPISNDVPKGFPEVSFRAQTYMKTVWDIFQLCAALLPNYIVAVRPFMDRSTVFYGKPHWMYTSGVVALTTGLKDNDPGAPALDTLDPSATSADIATERQKANQLTPEQYYDQLQSSVNDINNTGQLNNQQDNTQGGDPNSTTAAVQGIPWSGGDVRSLPQTAPNGAKIPSQRGGTGIEMHLPTSDNLQTDIQQHKQLPSLPVQWRHPFYMDRAGGSVGGLARINTPSSGKTVLQGDDPNAPGNHGAFGLLDPEIEQYYMNMRWDYSASKQGKNAYLGRRVLVYDENTKKAVICAIGDYGPAASTGLVSGLSPDAFFSLGANQRDICYYGFVPDNTALGPVNLTPGQITGSGLPAPVTNTGSTGAGTGTTTTPSSSDAGNSNNMKWFDPSSGLQPEQFSLKWGATKNISVDFTSKDHGITDKAGDAAKDLYKENVSDSEADQIWREFRTSFKDDAKATWEKFAATSTVPKATTDKEYPTVIQQFIQIMWQNPYNRGWVVRVADARHTVGGELTGDLASLAGNIPLIGAPVQTAVNDVGGIVNDVITVDETVASVGNKALSIVTGGLLGGILGGSGGVTDQQRLWDFSAVIKAFNVWLTNGGGDSTTSSAPLVQYMINNKQPGLHARGLIGQVAEDVQKNLDDVWHFVDHIYQGVFGTLTGVINLFRNAITSITGALSMANYASVQANALNAMFNDSLYYNVGDPNSPDFLTRLVFYADNVFTREYGEPVVEIREPFQRMHFINSWQHILDNKLIENLEEINTVVTATSNGKHPVTVYFDKGAPSQHQKEKFVETGLYWDHPTGLSRIFDWEQQLREWSKFFNGNTDETSSKRVALWHLKKSLQDIYKGEIIILGDPSIRPYDLVYMWDAYEKIGGFIEVEQVVHSFNPQMGFTTSITPNAIVTINDPGRWTIQSMIHKQFATQALRNDMRHAFAERGFGANPTPQTVQQQLINNAESALVNNQQYTGGPGAIMRDLAGAGGIGAIVTRGLNPTTAITAPGLNFSDALNAQFGSEKSKNLGAWASHATLFGIPINPVGWAQYKAFNWLKDNVFDAHGCYINYLSKNGRPMDAGLSYNHGVAVGQTHTARFLSDSLGIEVPITLGGVNGPETSIFLNDLLNNLGWPEKDIESFYTGSKTLWESFINDNLLQLSGRGAESSLGVPPPVYWVQVIGVENGGLTIEVSPSILGSNLIDLDFLAAPKAPVSDISNPTDVFIQGLVSATQAYVVDELGIEGAASREGIFPSVAVRINSGSLTAGSNGKPARIKGTIFYRTPTFISDFGDPTLSPEQKRRLYLAGGNGYTGIANKWPDIQWDTLDDTGFPYSLNYELVLTSKAQIDPSILNTTIQGQGVIFGGAP